MAIRRIMSMEQATSESVQNDSISDADNKSGIARLILISIITLFIMGYSISIYWSIEPEPVNIETDMIRYSDSNKSQVFLWITCQLLNMVY